MLDHRPAVPSVGPRPGQAGAQAGRTRAGIAVLGIALALLLARTSDLVERLDALAFDAQARVLRALRAPRAADADGGIVIVGLDEPSLDALHVPMALVHAGLGRTLEAIAAARPRIIGLDIALPERSADGSAPGMDLALMRGLVAARTRGLVVAVDLDGLGHPRLPYLPLLAAAGGPSALGLPLFALDPDGVVRRFEPEPGRIGPSAAAPAPPAPPTFAARIAQRLGCGPALERPGWIDFTRGAAFAYLPLRDVLERDRAGDAARLEALFEGKVVLVGSVLPFLDRLRLPMPLAAWEPAQRAPPGVVVNAQLLRDALGAGLVRPVARPIAALLGLGLVAVLVAGGSAGRLRRGAAVLLLACAADTAAHAGGYFAPPATALLAGSVALGVLAGMDRVASRRARTRLQGQLGGYLSPRLLQALIDGRVDPDGTRRSIALLFADLRGFTAWSERADPGTVRDLLNRYYARITPLLHAHGGTIDNFRGDGVMVMFGAVQELPRCCEAALDAARALVAAVAALDAEMAGERHDPPPMPLRLSIGLAFGEVVFGDVGSAERKDFTALGDAVNVAARLQELAKSLGVTVLMTQEFARRLAPGQPGLHDLGVHELKGHSPVAVWTWHPPGPGPEAA